MADGFFPLSNTQQEWAARATEIAQRELAPRAAETDRTGTFPSEQLEALKREGFWKLRVSREHGGLEADLLTTVLSRRRWQSDARPRRYATRCILRLRSSSPASARRIR